MREWVFRVRSSAQRMLFPRVIRELRPVLGQRRERVKCRNMSIAQETSRWRERHPLQVGTLHGAAVAVPSSITNVVSPGGASYLLRAVMYPYTPPGATSPLSAGTAANPTCFDSSPNFLEDPQVISCTGVDVVYNNLRLRSRFGFIVLQLVVPMGRVLIFSESRYKFSELFFRLFMEQSVA